jgi:hypothetical protein
MLIDSISSCVVGYAINFRLNGMMGLCVSFVHRPNSTYLPS